MLRVRCDLHVHTALSPCADPDMTPGGIVAAAVSAGIAAIAITDHNSARNAWAVSRAAADDLIVVPGIEAWTREDVHMLCLFPGLLEADAFGHSLYEALPHRNNDTRLFGEQLLLDEGNCIIGFEERLLLSPTDWGVEDVCERAIALGGVVIPSHVDRAYGLVKQLGIIPPSLPIGVIEVTRFGAQLASTLGYPSVTNSDAHSIDILKDSPHWELEVEEQTSAGVIEGLRRKYPPAQGGNN